MTYIRRAMVLGVIPISACVQAPSGEARLAADLAPMTDGAISQWCADADGCPERPVVMRDRSVANEVFGRLMAGRFAQEAHGVRQWLTATQLQRVDGVVANPIQYEGATSNEEFEWTALDRADLSAKGLYDLVSGSRTGGEWPNDGESVALRLAATYPDQVARALAEGARQFASDDIKLASWCVRCLLRMQRWHLGVLGQGSDEFPWYCLKLVCADAFGSMEQWYACAAAMQGVRVETLTGGDPVARWDRAIGEMYALVGDKKVLPTHFGSPDCVSESAWQDLAGGNNVQLILELVQLDVAKGLDVLLPIHVVGQASPAQTAALRRLAPRSCAATAALCELGHADAQRNLFWGVQAGVRAAHHAMDGAQGEVAWRSGIMTDLLVKALEHGSDWCFWAQYWLLEGNRSLRTIDRDAFGRRLRAVLSNSLGVRAARSPFTGEWGLIPAREIR